MQQQHLQLDRLVAAIELSEVKQAQLLGELSDEAKATFFRVAAELEVARSERPP